MLIKEQETEYGSNVIGYQTENVSNAYRFVYYNAEIDWLQQNMRFKLPMGIMINIDTLIDSFGYYY